jgi:hypothetical protein
MHMCSVCVRVHAHIHKERHAQIRPESERMGQRQTGTPADMFRLFAMEQRNIRKLRCR